MQKNDTGHWPQLKTGSENTNGLVDVFVFSGLGGGPYQRVIFQKKGCSRDEIFKLFDTARMASSLRIVASRRSDSGHKTNKVFFNSPQRRKERKDSLR
jgi:hypothetical protein